MTLRSLFGLTLVLLAFVPALAQTAQTAQTDKVDDYIQAEMRKRHIPSLALAVTHNGKVVKQKAYGLANVELNVPATPETLYQIASTMKTFTAAAVLKLVEEGKLSLDDSVTKWLPEVPAGNFALDEDKVLKRATLDQMWSAAKLANGKVFRFGGTAGYAHGWVVDDRPGHKSVGHSGGGSTAYWRFLDDKLNVIVLTNLQGSDPDSIAQGVAALYVPQLVENGEQ